MNELKTLNFDTQTVSARELHERLNIEIMTALKVPKEEREDIFS